jgi:hypothetical protein
MVADLQTKTIFLILLDQRGTALFWRCVQGDLANSYYPAKTCKSDKAAAPGGRSGLACHYGEHGAA